MSKRNIFDTVSSVQLGRSVFDLSYDKKLTCDMGELIPVMCDEMVPGDKFDIGNQIVVRFQPLVAPILHEINAFVHYFFVPFNCRRFHGSRYSVSGCDRRSGQYLCRD